MYLLFIFQGLVSDWVDDVWDPSAQGSGKKKWSTLPASCTSWSRQQYNLRSLSESKKTDDSSDQLEQPSSPPEIIKLVILQPLLDDNLVLLINNKMYFNVFISSYRVRSDSSCTMDSSTSGVSSGESGLYIRHVEHGFFQ